MSSRFGTTDFFRSALAGALAVALLQIGTGYALAQSVEFSATVPSASQGGGRLWPRAIVTFADRVLIPVAAICDAHCNGLAIRQKGKAKHHQLVLVDGQGPMAIVPVTGERLVLTACVNGSCMDYRWWSRGSIGQNLLRQKNRKTLTCASASPFGSVCFPDRATWRNFHSPRCGNRMQAFPIKCRRSRLRAGCIFRHRLRCNRFQQPFPAVPALTFDRSLGYQIDRTVCPPFTVSSEMVGAFASAHSTNRVPSASGAACDLLRAGR